MLVPKNFTLIQTKLTEHHIERHYEVDSDKSIFLQRMAVSDEFFEYRFSHCLGVEELTNVDDWLLDFYGSEDVVQEFEFLHYSTFISFFRNNGIDIPRCFRKTKSVKRAVNEIDLLKMNNYLMRHGLRYKAWVVLSKVISNLNLEYITSLNFNSTITIS